MISDNVIFCNRLLKEARDTAFSIGLRIGKLTTYTRKAIRNIWCEVYEDDKTIWTGYASCASDAKAHAVRKLIDEYAREH